MNRLACLIIISSLAAACGSSSNNTPTADQYDDTAQQLGSTTSTGGGGGETGSMSDAITIATSGTLTGFTIGSSGTLSGTHLGLTYDYALTCKDAGGSTLASCTALTDTADAKVDWSGNLAVTDLAASVTRSSDWQISGIQSGTATFDGSGSFTLGATVMSIFRPVTAMYTLTADATYDGVLVDTSTQKAIGGDISYAVTATDTTTNTASGSNDSNKFDINATITFAADASATMTLDGSHKYAIDTTTGVVTKISAN